MRCVRVGAVCSNSGTGVEEKAPESLPRMKLDTFLEQFGGTSSPERTSSEGSSEFTDLPPPSVPVVAPLPPNEIMNLITTRYLTELYDTFPISVRPPLLQELGTTTRIPDFLTVATMLFTVRWDPLLPRLIGVENRTNILKLLFDRLKDGLSPAIDSVLPGYDAIVGDPRTKANANQYISLSVWVLQALAHVLATIISVPVTDSAGSDNFRDLLRLASSVALNSRLTDDGLFGEQLQTAQDSTLVEHGQRAWCFIVSMDNFFATMQGTDPVIDWCSLSDIKMPASDAASGVLSGDAGDPLPSDWSAAAHGTKVSTAVFVVSDIHARISSFRRDRAIPWTTHPVRAELQARLTAWYANLPPIDGEVTGLLARSPRPIPATVAALVHLNILYHSAAIALCAPSESALWKGEADPGWFASDAFVVAQQHALCVSEILAPLADPEGGISGLGLPMFQYGVLLAGMIHLIFFRILPGSEFNARAEVSGQLAVYAACLRKGQAALGIGERRSWWHERWIQISELS